MSTKTRKNKTDCFGFVRYKSIQEAEDAMSVLHEHVVRGRKLWVSMAKYGKDGGPATNGRSQFQKLHERISKAKFQQQGRFADSKFYGNRNPGFRDGRRYSDVVAGVRKQVDELKKELMENMKVIPVTHSINVKEDTQIAKVLERAIVAENSEVLNLHQIQSEITACKVNVSGLFYLSPTKLLLAFDCQLDAMNAVDIESPLWNVFDNLTLWSEGVLFDDRLLWIDCIGVHPLCCSKETLKTIGELWGPVIQIENKVQGIETISGARILIKTKAQNKIDNRIRLVYDHGSCDVWVKEHYGSCTNFCAGGNVNMGTSKLQQVEVLEQGTLDCSLDYANSPPFDDPLVQEFKTRTMNGECHSWVDPIVSNENIYWSDVDSGDCCHSRQVLTCPFISPSRASKSSRPRGRPKKSSDRGLLEARKT